MKDYADKETEKELKRLEKEIKDEYRSAYETVAKRLDDYLEQFDKEDKAKAAMVKNGEMTDESYMKWRESEILKGDRWLAMRETLAEDVATADKKAASMIFGYLPEAYSIHFNFAVYEAEKGSLTDTAFTLYSRETVESLLKKKPRLLPRPKVKIEKAKRWSSKNINSVVTQGVLQGEELRTIAKNLETAVGMSERAAIRNARTAMTAAQNSGRNDGYKRCVSMGIRMQKQWVATLDYHTRKSHGELDGETVDIDASFSNGCKYPGDPDGKPCEVYNCRCSMKAYFPEYEDEKHLRYDNDARRLVKYKTYKEWRAGHGS